MTTSSVTDNIPQHNPGEDILQKVFNLLEKSDSNLAKLQALVELALAADLTLIT